MSLRWLQVAFPGAMLVGSLMLSAGFASADGFTRGKHTARDSWTGIYVGTHAGVSGSDVSFAFTNFGTEADHRGYGLVGGLQAGYNLQFSGLVVGVEADVAWGNVHGESRCPNASFRCGHDVDMLASLRARAGVLLAPSMLVFLTGGAAWADAGYEVRNVTTGLLAAPALSHTQNGSVFGGGVEVRITDNLSLKGEYLRFNLRDESVPNGTLVQTTGPVHLDLQIETVKVGLNWRF
jgi:outer membrane immunogenic protein